MRRKGISVTNADKIRSMIDEELAQKLIEFECLGFTENTLSTYEERLKYLKNEIEQ